MSDKAESLPSTDKLFSIGQILLATAIGAPVAGAVLIAHNYRVLKKPLAANVTYAAGIIGTVLVAAIAFVLPDNFPNFVIPTTYCLITRQVVIKAQGSDIRHYETEGRKASWLIATIVGILGLVVLVGLIIAVIFLVFPE